MIIASFYFICYLIVSNGERQLLGAFGSIFRNLDTRTLKPMLRRECFGKQNNKLISQEHPLVFACPGTGEIRMNFRVEPSVTITTVGDPDALVVQVAKGRDCLSAPNIALLEKVRLYIYIESIFNTTYINCIYSHV